MMKFKNIVMVLVAASFIYVSASAQADCTEDQCKIKPWKQPRIDNSTSETADAKLVDAASKCRYILDKNLKDKQQESAEYDACLQTEFSGS